MQIVKVEWPGQNVRPLAAWLDLDARCLHLQQVSLAQNSKKITLGAGTAVNFDQVSSISIREGLLEIQGPGGVALVRLHMDTTEEIQTWSAGLRAAFKSSANPAANGGAGDQGDDAESLADALRSLIVEQEARLARLEELKRQKEEQLLKMHGHLESSLSTLQSGQKMYAEQHKIMETQQGTVDDLVKALSKGDVLQAAKASKSSGAAPASPSKASGAVPRSPSAPETAVAAGRAMAAAKLAQPVHAMPPAQAPPRATAAFAVAAAAAARVAEAKATSKASRPVPAPQAAVAEQGGAEEEPDSRMLALMRRTEELQNATAQISDAARNAGNIDVFDAQPELMAMLGTLIQEKNQLEAKLREEQEELEEQLASLHAARQ